jgi:hypothetical protein
MSLVHAEAARNTRNVAVNRLGDVMRIKDRTISARTMDFIHRAMPWTTGDENENLYGRCPVCGAPGKTRERRPNGNDVCHNGHTYPSSTAIR